MEDTFYRMVNKQAGITDSEGSYSMNTEKITIPYQYFKSVADLNWNDIYFAIRNSHMPPEGAIDFALDEIELSDDYPQTHLDLAILTREEAYYHIVMELLEKITTPCDGADLQQVKSKLLYVLLHWIYDHRRIWKDEDPLDIVMSVYDDFGFPESMNTFVRVVLSGKAPPRKPVPKTPQEAIEQMYRNWERFLEKERSIYNQGVRKTTKNQYNDSAAIK